VTVSSVRPLADFGRLPVRKPESQVKRKRDTWIASPLCPKTFAAALALGRERLADNPSLISELERTGRERALIYKTLFLTGLRKGELASLTIGQVVLDGPRPHFILEAADEKNRQGSPIPLRRDLADDLRGWLATVAQETHKGDPPSKGAKQTEWLARPLFQIPDGLVRILNRDLAAAGIPKVDERGRTIDVHAFRHTFGTLLSKGGVLPRTAQAAMRHSTIDLTMNVYTDPELLDVETALDSLPRVSLDLPLLPPNLDADHGNGEGTSDTEQSFQPLAMMQLGPRRLRVHFDSEEVPEITPTRRRQVPPDAHCCTDKAKVITEAEADQTVVTRAPAKKKALIAGVASKASGVGMTGDGHFLTTFRQLNFCTLQLRKCLRSQ